MKELSELDSNSLREVFPKSSSYTIEATRLSHNNLTKGHSEKWSCFLPCWRKLCRIPVHTGQCLSVVMVVVRHCHTLFQDRVLVSEKNQRAVDQSQKPEQASLEELGIER